jgi:GR25 family glycosyltransferase involved in LPS biosynthesis
LIKKVYYINLDKRKDRREYMEQNVLSKLPYEKDMIKRITACDMTHSESYSKRQAGCCISHMTAWSDAIMNNYDCVMILEDDFEFTCDFEIFEKQIQELFEKFPDFGVCNFSYNPQAPLYQLQNSDNIFYCPNVQTTSGYIIRTDYMYALLPIIGHAVSKLLNDEPPTKYAIDQAWKVLQTNLRWLVMKKVGKQRHDFSDIENCPVGYTC